MRALRLQLYGAYHRQEESGEDTDDGNGHEQFGQRESASRKSDRRVVTLCFVITAGLSKDKVRTGWMELNGVR
jgi:hypothetical protein